MSNWTGSLVVFLFTFTVWGTQAQAQTQVQPQPPLEAPSAVAPPAEAAQALQDIKRESLGSAHRRVDSNWSLIANYSLIDSWLPSKWGGSVSYYDENGRASWEVEYLRGSFSVGTFIADLGSMTEEKWSVLRRFYGDRRSFHYALGLTYHELGVHLGDELFASASGYSALNADFARQKTLAFTAGLGQRWIFSHGISLQVDWISLSLPFTTLESHLPFLGTNAAEQKKSKVRKAFDFFEKIPTFALFRIGAGWSF